MVFSEPGDFTTGDNASVLELTERDGLSITDLKSPDYSARPDFRVLREAATAEPFPFPPSDKFGGIGQ